MKALFFPILWLFPPAKMIPVMQNPSARQAS